MAKYVIEIPDEVMEFVDNKISVLVEPTIRDETNRYFAFRVSGENISLYTEPDEQEIIDKAHEEAWDNSRTETVLKRQAQRKIDLLTFLDEIDGQLIDDPVSVIREKLEEVL